MRSPVAAFCLLSLTVVVCRHESGARAAPNPPGQSKADRIATLETYFADTYAKPLAEKNRLSQLIAVMSLARVDAPPVTRKLVAATLESDPLVGQLAWEAVHARQSTLTPVDRDKWLSAGVDIAHRGGFPGQTIAPLLLALREKPAAKFKNLPDVLARVAIENDPAAADGKPALDAASEAIAAWRDPRVVQVLLARVQKTPALAPRVKAMLAGLPDPPADTDDPKKFAATWLRYLRVNKLTPPATQPSYAGISSLLPAPEKIADPNDKKWRKDLELPKLDLDTVDLAICIDATGSMVASNTYVTAYVETVMRLLRLMSDEVRGGAVYYRHEVDEKLMLPCCREAPEQKDNFRTKTVAFTNDPKMLIAGMRAQKLAGKTGHGQDRSYSGAYAGGIMTAMQQMKWAAKGKRIIVCTGDDNATPGSEPALLELAKKAKDDGALLIFVVRDTTAAKATAAASVAATGLEPIIYKADVDKLKSASTQKTDVFAIEQFKGTAFEQMTTRVVQLTLPEGYRDRVKPLMAAVLPILQAQDSAARASAAVRSK